MYEGRTIGRYAVIERLGRGAMGEVYRAHDEVLDRDVALKVLPDGVDDPELRRALSREARILARLSHPNVETVFDYERLEGRDVMVTELVPGHTLEEVLSAGRLPMTEALDLGRQLAEGLAAAHAVGVVHCDLKPANARVTPDGRLKLVDFGVARRLRGDQAVEGEGAVAGTPAYMAPEQLGGHADARSDVYGAGAILYELVTGRCPRSGTRLTEVIASAAQAAVRPGRLARVPKPVEALIVRAMAPSPDERPRDGRALADALARVEARRLVRRRGLVAAAALALFAALWTLGTSGPRPPPAGPDAPSLVVDVVGRGPATAGLAEGLEAALVGALASAPEVRVRSAELPASEAAGPLHRLEGSVSAQGDEVRVRLVVKSADGLTRRWMDRVMPADALLGIPGPVARATLTALGFAVPATLASERARRGTAGGADYLRVLADCREDLFADTEACEARFTEVSRAHPQLIEAQVSRAWQAALAIHLQPEQTRPNAVRRRQVEAALVAAPDHPRARQAAALVALCDWRWREALALTEEAVRLGPGDPQVAFVASYVFTLAGRAEAAVAAAERARDLRPRSAVMHTNLGWAYLYARRFQEAIVPLTTAARLDPEDATPWRHLALVLLRLNRFDEARRAASEVARRNAGGIYDGYTDAALAPVYAIGGDPDHARRSLEAYADREDAEPYVLAVGYDALGNHARALELLAEAVEAHVPGVLFMKVDFLSDALRGTPRFQALLARVGPPRALSDVEAPSLTHR